MISIEELREMEPGLADKTDEEVLEIRELLYGLAQLCYETWEEDHKKK